MRFKYGYDIEGTNDKNYHVDFCLYYLFIQPASIQMGKYMLAPPIIRLRSHENANTATNWRTIKTSVGLPSYLFLQVTAFGAFPRRFVVFRMFLFFFVPTANIIAKHPYEPQTKDGLDRWTLLLRSYPLALKLRDPRVLRTKVVFRWRDLQVADTPGPLIPEAAVFCIFLHRAGWLKTSKALHMDSKPEGKRRPVTPH